MSDFESSQDHRRLAASGKPIPEEERATLQKDIQEQEALLQGYQKVCKDCIILLVLLFTNQTRV